MIMTIMITFFVTQRFTHNNNNNININIKKGKGEKWKKKEKGRGQKKRVNKYRQHREKGMEV